jgi:para-aminobenzoate synthetase component 1
LEFGNYVPLEFAAADVPSALAADLLTGTPRGQFLESLERARRYLRAGDIFQVNLAQHLLAPLRYSPTEFYARARRYNAAPFAGYLDLGNHQLVSVSPERLVRVRGLHVETRPIKGTRRLTGDQAADAVSGQQLRSSPKDCAENVMIVDLLRNDLSRVCSPASLRVERLCGLEAYRHVQHLVSVVTGDLAPGRSAWDLLPAVFPGGSISGAPKVRALEIINELEPLARGAYCGSLGYIGFPDSNGHASADWNILIRTATLCGNGCQIPVGGGIVLDSDPVAEYRETLDKARGLLLAAAPPWEDQR